MTKFELASSKNNIAVPLCGTRISCGHEPSPWPAPEQPLSSFPGKPAWGLRWTCRCEPPQAPSPWSQPPRSGWSGAGAEASPHPHPTQIRGGPPLTAKRDKSRYFSCSLSTIYMNTVQYGRYLETLNLAANRYLATSEAGTILGVLHIATSWFRDLKIMFL